MATVRHADGTAIGTAHSVEGRPISNWMEVAAGSSAPPAAGSDSNRFSTEYLSDQSARTSVDDLLEQARQENARHWELPSGQRALDCS